MTSSMEAYAGKRQWEIFQRYFAPGAEVRDESGVVIGLPGHSLQQSFGG